MRTAITGRFGFPLLQPAAHLDERVEQVRSGARSRKDPIRRGVERLLILGVVEQDGRPFAERDERNLRLASHRRQELVDAVADHLQAGVSGLAVVDEQRHGQRLGRRFGLQDFAADVVLANGEVGRRQTRRPVRPCCRGR